MKKLFLMLGGMVGLGAVLYFVTKDSIDFEGFASIKDKIPKIEFDKVRQLLEQKEDIEEKITNLATTITDSAKELVEKSSEYAQDKKQSLLNIIDEAKNAIQEEKEKLKEIRERLDNKDSEVV